MEMVKAVNLKKYYTTDTYEVRALDGVSLSVEEGEVLAIIGTSGSGKTTLLNMLGGLDVPTSGGVWIRGNSLRDMDAEERTVFRRRNIGFVFQQYNLVPVLSVYENLVLPLRLDGADADEKFLDEIVSLLGLSDKLERLPEENMIEVEYKGIKYKTIKELAKSYDVDYERLCKLRRKGWEIEKAMEICIQKVKGNGFLREYQGKLYRSPKVLAKELGLPYGSFTHFLQRCDSVEAAVERCREQQESKATLWGREYASRYELTESMGISYNAVAFAMNVKKVTLEEAIKTLLIKEAIRFEGKEYPTLVDLCTEYGVQASIVMERLQRGKTFYEAIYTPVKNNGIVNEIEYEGITYQNAASLCREYKISRTLVDGQKRYETGRLFLECFHLLRKLRDECGWPKDQTFSYIPRCKIEGKFYKHLATFSRAVNMTATQIESYKSKNQIANLVEALSAMQHERIPAYQTEQGLLTYTQIRKAGYTAKEIEKLPYFKDKLPRYPSLQKLHFDRECMDITERYERLFEKKPKRKRVWKEESR